MPGLTDRKPWRRRLPASAGARRSTSRRFSRTRTPGSRGCTAATRRARARTSRNTASSLPDARFTTSYEDVARGARRRHRLDHDAQSPARRSGGGRGPGRQAHRAREADRPRRRRAGADSRRRSPGRRPHHRLVRAALQPVSQGSRGGCANGGWLGDDPVCAHAVSVARHRLVQRVGLGAHARERPQPPARGRLPCRRRAALVLRPGAASR